MTNGQGAGTSEGTPVFDSHLSSLIADRPRGKASDTDVVVPGGFYVDQATFMTPSTTQAMSNVNTRPPPQTAATIAGRNVNHRNSEAVGVDNNNTEIEATAVKLVGEKDSIRSATVDSEVCDVKRDVSRDSLDAVRRTASQVTAYRPNNEAGVSPQTKLSTTNVEVASRKVSHPDIGAVDVDSTKFKATSAGRNDVTSSPSVDLEACDVKRDASHDSINVIRRNACHSTDHLPTNDRTGVLLQRKLSTTSTLSTISDDEHLVPVRRCRDYDSELPDLRASLLNMIQSRSDEAFTDACSGSQTLIASKPSVQKIANVDDGSAQLAAQSLKPSRQKIPSIAVSYTHLTLPTIYSV